MGSTFLREVFGFFVFLFVISCSNTDECQHSDYDYEFINQSKGVLPQDSDFIFFKFTTIELGKANENPVSIRIVSMEEVKQAETLGSPLLKILPCLSEKDSVVITKKSSIIAKSNDKESNIVQYGLFVDSILTKEQYNAFVDNQKSQRIKQIQTYRNSKNNIEKMVLDQLKTLVDLEQFQNLESGIRLKYLAENPNGKKAEDNVDIISLTYYICLMDGTWIDDSFRSGQSLQYLAGSSYFMSFFNNTVDQLRENEEAIFIVPASQVYDGKGFKGNITIPPGKDLVMYLKIEEIKENKHRGLN